MYSHQPDLNFENPRVRREIMEVADFWLEMGVDGFRLDAVPYLFEAEGTTCENLPRTHAFLKELRAHVDAKFPGRMLLAEANQWPEDAVAYFGDPGDECHMAFHFPLMPRLFMSVRMEDRFPTTEILEQTPPIPETCQWALFLRNHDELTLEMVTDEERDYMYRVYAAEDRARVNELGIRRRLAPLLANNRRLIELLNALLFSLNGTPVIYYGDEIGMGDNIYLGDRDSVRTPMQWSADRNAGFSRANPQKLYLPVIIDPEYHYESVNVDAQQANPSSLLWWMRRLIGLRRRHPAFARGSLQFVECDNHRVLAFVREYAGRAAAGGGEPVAVRAGGAPRAGGVRRARSRWSCSGTGGSRGWRVRSRTSSRCGPHSFYWFELAAPGADVVRRAEPILPEITGRCESGGGLRRAGAADLDAVLLAEYVPARRTGSAG
ncbi:alpha-amylase family glycosyl hydrolase [Tepidiforma flava]|uniref:Alpha-amylase family glycosyl hydrolase n=1 Tax=Tepidiforma flava TaxID=3004094 RepID=A0ABY7MEN8_9CHLR|nr:alpha-amylase family glycosyl hydrolase [Tepidiforma flava]WBL37548.1 alpha-amylase family glycosyl hydrolase [Tepidiforma flava]